MVRSLGLSPEEALQKMNALWKGLSFLGEDELIYHQDVDYWGEAIVFGKCRKRE